MDIIWIESTKTNLRGESQKNMKKTNANLKITKNTLGKKYTNFAFLSTADVLLAKK